MYIFQKCYFYIFNCNLYVFCNKYLNFSSIDCLRNCTKECKGYSTQILCGGNLYDAHITNKLKFKIVKFKNDYKLD